MNLSIIATTPVPDYLATNNLGLGIKLDWIPIAIGTYSDVIMLQPPKDSITS